MFSFDWLLYYSSYNTCVRIELIHFFFTVYVVFDVKMDSNFMIDSILIIRFKNSISQNNVYNSINNYCQK